MEFLEMRLGIFFRDFLGNSRKDFKAIFRDFVAYETGPKLSSLYYPRNLERFAVLMGQRQERHLGSIRCIGRESNLTA